MKPRRGSLLSPVRIAATMGLLCGLLVVEAPVATAAVVAGTSGTVTGTTFRDYNADGLDNTTATAALPAIDVGIGGVTVTAFDSTDAQVGTTTSAANGTYSLSVTAAASTAIRLEFTPPTGDFSGPIGTATGTDPVASGGPEQFVTLPTTGSAAANYGVVVPGDYCQSNPTIAIACLQGVLGDPASGATVLAPGTTPSLVTVPYDATGDVSPSGTNSETPQADVAQIGSTFGNATYQSSPTQAYDFTSAFLHRFAALGPAGLGGIYLTTVVPGQTGTPPAANTTTAAVVGNAGTDPRGTAQEYGMDGQVPTATGYDWFHDIAAYAAVDTIGLGGLSLSPDQSTLYTINLADNNLVVFPVNAPTTVGGPPTLGTQTSYPLPTALPGAASGTGCAVANIQSFAVESTATGAYVGLTCTGPTQGDLEGYVYTFTLNGGSFGAAPVLEIPFHGYNRGCVYPLCGTSTTPNDTAQTANWEPWSNTYPANSPDGVTEYPQPLLSAITVDSSGNMTVSVRDRLGDDTGVSSGSTTATDTAQYQGISAGGLYKACGSPLVLETDGTCGGAGGSGVGDELGPTGYGAANSGEFYYQAYPGDHTHTAVGGLAQAPGFANVVATHFDPTPGGGVRTGGFDEQNLSNGAIASSAILYNSYNQTQTFSKDSGLGDVALICGSAPIQIGHRVWIDSNRNGIQDPGETPAPAGVTVTLESSTGAVLATTTTNAQGIYTFSSTTTPAILPNTAYQVVVSAASGPLAGDVPTTANVGSDPLDNSKGVAGTGTNYNVATATFTTGSAGQSSLSEDFGFVTPAPAITLTKTPTPTTVHSVGDVITYSFVAKNTGDVPLTAVGVTDTQTAPAGRLTSGPTCSSLSGPPVATCSGATTTLVIGESATFTGTYTVAPADLGGTTITDSATVTGTPPIGPNVTATAPATVAVAPQTIAGNIFQCINGVPSTTLAPATGAALSAPSTPPVSGTNTITATDVAPATVTMSATAPLGYVFVPCGVATPPTIPAGGLTASQSVTVPAGGAGVGNFYVVAEAPSLSIVKSSTTTSITAVNQVVPFNFLVTNTGNVALSDISVADTSTAPMGALTSGPTCPAGASLPTNGSTVTCTGTYTVTQADLNNGSITDTAIAMGSPPSGKPVSSNQSMVTIGSAQTIAGNILVCNNGSTSGATAPSTVGTLSAPTSPLVSGGNTIPVTLVAAGTFTMSATAPAGYVFVPCGVSPGPAISNDGLSAAEPVVVPGGGAGVGNFYVVAEAPGLKVVKSASPTTVNSSNVGQTVGYNFVVTNTGNVALSAITVTDSAVAPSTAALDGTTTASCPSASLAPTLSETCTGVHTVTAADIAAGSIDDTATATGMPPSGPIVPSVPSTATVTVTQTIAGNIFLCVNNSVTGSTTLAPTGGAALTAPTTPTAVSGTNTIPATGTDAQTVTMSGTAPLGYVFVPCGVATPPTSPDNGVTATQSVVVPPGGAGVGNFYVVAEMPAITVVKSTTTASVSTVGTVVPYNFLVTNTGNVTLTNVAVTDTPTAPAGALTTGPICPGGTGSTGPTLLPTGTVICTGTYTVTQADLDNGSVSDAAVATGNPPSGSPTSSPPSTATVTATQTPALTVVKTADTKTITTVGQTVTYSFLVTNTGNVTMNNVSINDVQNASSGPLATGPTCPGATPATGTTPAVGPTLAPLQSVTCTATYVVTQADITRGDIADTATAQGIVPGSTTPTKSDPSSVTVPSASSTTPAGSSGGTSAAVLSTPIESSSPVTGSVGSSGPLAFTGAPVGEQIGLALGTLALGLCLVGGASRYRRRRRA